MSETEIKQAVTELQEAAVAAVQRATLLQLVPREAQLLTETEAMALLGCRNKKNFYGLRLPRYLPDGQPKAFTDKLGRRVVRAGTVRYRLADLIAHIEAHMRTAEGNLLYQRAMKRRPVLRPALTPEPVAA